MLNFWKISFLLCSKKCKVFYSLLRKLLWNITNLQNAVVTGREADQHDQQRMILLELCHLPAVVARVVQTAKHYTQRRSLQRRHWKPSYNGTAAYDSVWTLPPDGCCCSCSTGTEQNTTHKDDPRKDDFLNLLLMELSEWFCVVHDRSCRLMQLVLFRQPITRQRRYLFPIGSTLELYFILYSCLIKRQSNVQQYFLLFYIQRRPF